MTTTHGAELRSWANRKLSQLENENSFLRSELDARDRWLAIKDADNARLRAALEAAPDPWSDYPDITVMNFRAWYEDQRQAALGPVEGE